VGAGISAKSPQKAARRFLRRLTIPAGWTSEQWDTLGWAVRYHRGAEPDAEHGAFSKLSGGQQKNIRALAGVLRLSRGLRKSGVENGTGLRAENSPDALLLRVPGLVDTVETAALLATAKHLLETYLGKPLILKSVAKPEKVVALAPQHAEQLQIAAAAASD